MTKSSFLTHNLGFPRMGPNRELKKAIESFWKGNSTLDSLLEEAKRLKVSHWTIQKNLGIDLVPSNDFSLYDQVLDHAYSFGVIPARYDGLAEKEVGWDSKTYFAMAHGLQDRSKGIDVASLEMKKWFDTNYHYMVPEFTENQDFYLKHAKAVEEFMEAKDSLGIETKTVLIGPISFLFLGKAAAGSSPDFKPISLLPKLLPVYAELVKALVDAGAKVIQFDEPFLVRDHENGANLLESAYSFLRQAAPETFFLLGTYFDWAVNHEVPGRSARDIFSKCPVDAIHLDLVRGSSQLSCPSTLEFFRESQITLSLGLVEGRNIWKTDLTKAKVFIDEAIRVLGREKILLAPSCSLLHVPFSLDAEKGTNASVRPEILGWMSFAVEKLQELESMKVLVSGSEEAKDRLLQDNVEKFVKPLKTSPLIHDSVVQARLAAIDPLVDLQPRSTPFNERVLVQRQSIPELKNLLPTTTIGSFPQTKEVRAKRSAFIKGSISEEEYETFLKQETKRCIETQELLGLDVLVHGEFERTDMVEYFGEKMKGYVFSRNGWVQSYGSRCVKPPIIFGDVSRPQAMTVAMTKYAQSLTTKPVKGMLTGPITMLQWSFVRTDQPRLKTALQLALAIRDEVIDLEQKAGVSIIQVDEPAIREGLPLHGQDQAIYLKWAVESFLVSTNRVQDATQIHTHMCYSDFNEIFETIVGMDADVLTVESSKSDLKLLQAFFSTENERNYPNDIGPGVYDIHTPRIPTLEEIKSRIMEMLKYIPKERLWINPDCGLKTRQWTETEAALTNLVEVVRELRRNL